MATQLRDTQLGLVVRLLSGRRLFAYPDQLDGSLWKTFQANTTHPSEEDLDEEAKVSAQASKSDGDVVLVGWYDAHDPENPQNWPSWCKLLIVSVICLMNFAFYLASSIVTPAFESTMEDFGVSQTVATLGLSLFSLGYGLGPMLWSPLAEMPKVGRRDLYFFTMLAFVLLQLPTGYAINVPMYLVFRFIAGFVGSPALAVGGATIGDMYQPAQLAYGFTIYATFGVFGPVFGPLLGGFAAQASGWRLTIWIIAWLGAFTVIVLFFCMPETSAATILYKRAKRLRQATGMQNLRCQSEIDAAEYTAKDHRAALLRAFTLTFGEPIVFLFDLYTALL
ncbi:uncharacterized protein LTR77_009946 [Saxophila tyrrhenica]|uniref:Major facilitator superfamily (MFS) profile domain-containing protein n=1 Tax=Saxophila tyrrhenica TaxID=1690608 RepID=A0AAV9NZA6_9PEZI|nr:hypothetical protein LTR77_009946 [Saxophila tyrrhenica]